MPNPKHVLLPGQFTKVKLLLDVRENATVVPLKSVIIEKGGAYVFVMRRDSTVERRFIELGPEFQNQVVVERGLVPGETIVVEGYHKLSPGMKVKVNNALLKKKVKREGRAYESKFLYRQTGIFGCHLYTDCHCGYHRTDDASH